MANPQKAVPNPQSFKDLVALIPDPGHDGYEFFSNVGTRTLEKTVEFSRVNMWFLVETCFLTYAVEPSFVTAQLQKIGMTARVFGFDRDSPPHIVVASNSELIIVAFRGTRLQQLTDILADLAFIPERTSAGFVHRGFQKAFECDGIWEEVLAYMGQIRAGQVVLFTGHSLGAALATIARRAFQDEGGQTTALYTFGSPRVGDELLFCSKFPPNSYRIVNDEDLVTHIPNPPIYGHVGDPYGIDGQPLAAHTWDVLEGQFRFIGAALSRFKCEDRRDLLNEQFAQSSKPLWDHAPQSYVAKVWNAL